ncbi:MAG: glucose-6-phosphate isomerase [Candidatus Nomurabacteria bacterium]|jgi:glucose-6-phosphate isomerase|nr:glucose-6-phosphate isomerase [Candidatus Nomurabacteria bacterium]
MLELNTEYAKSFISDDEMAEMWPRVEEARKRITENAGEGSEYLGWRDLPETYNRDEFDRIKTTAEKIRDDNKTIVIIGIGGSYAGAQAVTDLFGRDGDNFPKMVFAGNNLSSIETSKILRRLETEGKDWSIIVISKSGDTLEPSTAFDIFHEKLIERYGEEEANRRTYAITDANKGSLHDLATEKGWERFVVPDDIGGRYSVLTAVGLLPITVAGVDIDELMSGAKEAKEKSITDAMTYAAIRNILYNKGFKTEVLAYSEPIFYQMAEWREQLFAESEGKDGKGIWPSPFEYPKKLHASGQFIQDGDRQLFETVVNIEKTPVEVNIPSGGKSRFAGESLSSVNQRVYRAMVGAHSKVRPIMTINIPELTPFEIGYFIYFMEMSAALSAYTMGVNPFNQPGVEEYKRNIRW